MYVGDCTSSLRYNMFRDYEKHPYGTFEGNYQQLQQRKSYYTTVQGKLEKAEIINSKDLSISTNSV